MLAQHEHLHRHVPHRRHPGQDQGHAGLGVRHLQDQRLDLAGGGVLLQLQGDEQHLLLHVVLDQRRGLGRLVVTVVLQPGDQLGGVGRLQDHRGEGADLAHLDHVHPAVRAVGTFRTSAFGRGAAQEAVAHVQRRRIDREARLGLPQQGGEQRVRAHLDHRAAHHRHHPGKVPGVALVLDQDVGGDAVGPDREHDLLARLIDGDLLIAEEPAAGAGRGRRAQGQQRHHTDRQGCALRVHGRRAAASHVPGAERRRSRAGSNDRAYRSRTSVSGRPRMAEESPTFLLHSLDVSTFAPQAYVSVDHATRTTASRGRGKDPP